MKSNNNFPLRKRLNYVVIHTVPGGWFGLVILSFIAIVLILMMRLSIPICNLLPLWCWAFIFPFIVFASIFWMGMFGGFPTEYITEDEEEKRPLSEAPSTDKLYDPKNGLKGPEEPQD